MQTERDQSVGTSERGQPGQPVTLTCPPAATALSDRTARLAPLDESDFLLIRQAAIRRRAAHGAARTALASSVVTLFIGISAVPLVFLWPSWEGALMAAGLCIIGAVEYQGCRRMRQADPVAAKILGRNQLTLLGLIILYCLVQMLTFSPEHAKAAAISPEVRSQLAALPSMEKAIDSEIERLAPLATYGFYGLVIALSVVFQGGLALYYYTRRRHLHAFHTQTPSWVRRLFVETGA